MSHRTENPRAATAVATEVGRSAVGRELAAEAAASLGDRPANLCVLFASAHFEDEFEQIVCDAHEALGAPALIGTTAESVICNAHEYENEPAVVLWAAHLPNTRAVSFHLSQDDLERLASPDALREHLHVQPQDAPWFVLLGDPFSFNVVELLERLDEAYPGRAAIGGMASAAEQPGQNCLAFDGQTLHHGLVGVALSGDVQIDTVVSQGCRPIGRHLVITKAEQNIIYQLGGKPAMAAVNEVLQNCPPRDLELARRGLLVGCVINEYQRSFARGDFLIRNPIGFDSSSGAMKVNDSVRTGQTIQFQVRDGDTADEDLSMMLTADVPAPAAAALAFNCNGRGTRLFDERHHDARAITRARGGLPMAGFFCAGEIGPIGERNFLHGHTISIGFLRNTEARNHV